MDKIYVKDLQFFAYHGVFEEEKKNGQNFIINLVLEMDLSAAGTSDDLARTVNYGTVYDIAKEVTVNQRFDLIETLAETLSQRILREFPRVNAVTVRVDKPLAPGSDGGFHAAVELRREQQ